MSAVDDEFRPASITVPAGTTAVWTNDGQNPHTVTANDGSFDSGTLEPGQSFSVTFDQAGEAPYYCQIHGSPGSGMRGIVVVEAAAPAPAGGDEESPIGGVAATGSNPIPLMIVALVLASLGLAVLRSAGRSRTGGG